jgi:hypothetical protein
MCWWLRGLRPSPLIPVFLIPAIYMEANVHEDGAAGEDSSLLEFDTVLLGKWFLKF